MKKISTYIPNHLAKKSLLIGKFESYIQKNFPKEIISQISVLNISGTILILGVKKSSFATLMRFEKQKYIHILEKNDFFKIDDIKIIVDS
ncbi:MAG: hypothetical protein CMD65_04365 [Gammaproteobacteria bacterium]|nr:hypothetical protein [Gammaproteobacteria bacterium]|tara:strand:- start:428 stop:697 length:270 start_codon:yes stop_codon:yes gene_type:complete